jgi:hypothetical protein
MEEKQKGNERWNLERKNKKTKLKLREETPGGRREKS